MVSGYKAFLRLAKNKTSRLGQDVLFFILFHHQSKNADVAIRILAIPVVAVQAISVEITEVEAIAVGVAKICQTPSKRTAL